MESSISQSDIEVIDVTDNQPTEEDVSLRMMIASKKYHSNQADLESCFSSSDEFDDDNTQNDNPFDVNTKQPNFLPLYRKQHGGILIYDIDAEIPCQPRPKQELYPMANSGSEINETEPDNSLLNRHLKLKDFLRKANNQISENCNLNFTKLRKFDNNGKGLYKLTTPPEDEIPVRFESRFENGNLKKAIKVSDTEYNLILNFDYNTNGHTQWYYFKIMTKLSEGTSIKLNILNLMKPDSLYNYGMKPCVKSKLKPKEGWHRDCHDISYTRNSILRDRNKAPGENVKSNGKLAQYYYFTLSFTYTLKADNDEVSFAHAVPYTYNGNLLPFLHKIGREQKYHNFLRIGTLCKTLARNDCKMITITDRVKSYRDCNQELKWMSKNNLRTQLIGGSESPEKTFYGKPSKPDKEPKFKGYGGNTSGKKKKKNNKLERNFKTINKIHGTKKGIVISSRVHPGEAQSSWVMQGLIEFLVSNDPVAVQLRKHYIFKILPMLNPDGVIYGNYRCSLLGFDLNRRWLDPRKHLDPTIYYLKKMMKVFQEETQIELFCDLHGHSRKKNAFMYGCTYDNKEGKGFTKNFKLRSFPSLLSNKNDFFNFKGCSFKLEKSKEKTGRIVCFKELGILHSYTQESTFYGRDMRDCDDEGTDLHMGIEDFQNLGKDLVRTLSYLTHNKFMQNLNTEAQNYEQQIYGEINSSEETNPTTYLNSESSMQVRIPSVQLDTLSEELTRDLSDCCDKVISTFPAYSSGICKAPLSSMNQEPIKEIESEGYSSDSDDEECNLLGKDIADSNNSQEESKSMRDELEEAKVLPRQTSPKSKRKFSDMAKKSFLQKSVLSKPYRPIDENKGTKPKIHIQQKIKIFDTEKLKGFPNNSIENLKKENAKSFKLVLEKRRKNNRDYDHYFRTENKPRSAYGKSVDNHFNHHTPQVDQSEDFPGSYNSYQQFHPSQAPSTADGGIDSIKKRLMFVSKLSGKSFEQKKQERMREASNILKFLSNNYSTDDDYMKTNFQSSKPVLNSRKKINDLLLSGLTFTNKESEVKCLVETDSIRSKYKPRGSGKNTIGLNRASLTSHQPRRRGNDPKPGLNEYSSYPNKYKKANTNSFLLRPVARNPNNFSNNPGQNSVNYSMNDKKSYLLNFNEERLNQRPKPSTSGYRKRTYIIPK
ncbi:unnamed protein product [Moneuplotes crassus]|uniref:Peptidase M14 domain-containing protein n=1 Tax=Euplotes crassus TaxID=5936 RepID=A0AAD1UAZ3_EUPCR|nr:unnamed protein product [Moneuplotes crassus]